MTDLEMEKILKSLGNRRRMQIMKLLKRKRLTVSGIANEMKLSLRAVSRHLNSLYSNGLLDREQHGLNVFYKFNRVKISELARIFSSL